MASKKTSYEIGPLEVKHYTPEVYEDGTKSGSMSMILGAFDGEDDDGLEFSGGWNGGAVVVRFKGDEMESWHISAEAIVNAVIARRKEVKGA